MITIDNGKCTGCGVCLKLHSGYCLNKADDGIRIDYSVCNDCQKCIAICPKMAFSNRGCQPVRIENEVDIKTEDFMELLMRRRSIKHFTDKKIPKEILNDLIHAPQYAPSMNKNIEAIIVDDEKIIKRIDDAAMNYFGRIYNLIFKYKLLMELFKVFSETLPVIKRKMERDLFQRGQIVKENTQALILMIGNTKIPVTESSAQYYFANMILYSELAGIGSCLMDSLKIAVNKSKSVKDSLNIPNNFKILGILAVGYPNERILNIPQGYKIMTGWNSRGQLST